MMERESKDNRKKSKASEIIYIWLQSSWGNKAERQQEAPGWELDVMIVQTMFSGQSWGRGEGPRRAIMKNLPIYRDYFILDGTVW